MSSIARAPIITNSMFLEMKLLGMKGLNGIRRESSRIRSAKAKRVLFRKGWPFYVAASEDHGETWPGFGYTCKKYRVHSSKSYEVYSKLLARDFNNQSPGACVVSDWTYVRVGPKGV